MAIQQYGTALSRNLIRAAQGMLEHAQPITVLGDFGTQREMPQNQTDTLVFRRTLPFGATPAGLTITSGSYAGYINAPNVNAPDFVLGEGVTPNANTISFQDISVQLQQYGILFKYSSKIEMLYEDDVPGEMQKLVGETLAEVMELVRYGVLKAGSVVQYAGNVSSRSLVNSPITLNLLRKAARVLETNRARRVTSRLAPGPNFNTRSVQPAFVVFVHTDMVSDVRNLPGFTRVEDYGTFKPIHDREVGVCEDFRFVTSPLFRSFLAAGSATLNGCLSVGNTNVDVYPAIIIGEDAWGQVALKGMSAIRPIVLKASQTNHANPLGQFGYVGASTWFAAVRLNEAWMARVEAGVTNL